MNDELGAAYRAIVADLDSEDVNTIWLTALGLRKQSHLPPHLQDRLNRLEVLRDAVGKASAAKCAVRHWPKT